MERVRAPCTRGVPNAAPRARRVRQSNLDTKRAAGKKGALSDIKVR